MDKFEFENTEELFNEETAEQNSQEIEEFFDNESTTAQFDSIEPDEDENNKKKKLDKKKVYLYIALGVIAFLLLVYFAGVLFYKYHFLPGTEINGVNVSNLTEQEALTQLNNSLFNRQVTLEGDNGQTAQVSGSQIELAFNNQLGELQKLLDEQRAGSWQFVLFTKKEIDLSTDYKYSPDALMILLNSLPIVSGPGVTPPTDARIDYNGSEFVILPAVQGNQPNVDKLSEAVVNALVNNQKTINLAGQGLYNQPAVTQDNPILQNDLNALNTACKAIITMTFPSQNVVLDKQTFAPWLNLVDNQLQVNQDNLQQYIDGLAAQFNTNNKVFTFKTTEGATKEFTDRSGWILNTQGMVNELRSQILKGEVVTEAPIWSQRGQQALTGNSITGTYVEISLGQQMVWIYRNNALVGSSSIVSGDVRDGESSLTGLFSIQSKNTSVSMNVKLPDGNTSNENVNYWIPYSEHFGILSATWRNQFGGDIYRTQGTDGDIDVPNDMAQTIYNTVDVGTPVVIY